MLVTVRTFPRFRRLGCASVEAVVRRFWPEDVPYEPPTRVFDGLTVPMRVNHGKCIVDCPFCSGAQFADPQDRRFFCVECLHLGTDAAGCWLRVEWPQDIDTIAEALKVRRTMFRNWCPGEPVAKLWEENKVQGAIG